MAEYDDEELAVAAAKILLSLRTRKLTRWPDWIPPERPSVDAEAELPPLPEGWPKRPRGELRMRESGWSLSLDGLFARLWQPAPDRFGASSSEEERAWSPPRSRKVKRVSLPARKEAFMAASSPETPFDYATAARSGASSSGDEWARSTAKRKARRSGDPSSGDEGCSSPAKRMRADVHGAGQDVAAAIKVEVPKTEENNRDEQGHLLFDLNEDISMAW